MTIKIPITLTAVVAALALFVTPALAVAPEAPTLTVEEPVHATEAVFHGVLNPNLEGGPASFPFGEYEFLYKQGATCAGGVKAPSSPAISIGGGMEPVSQTVTGLKANTKYTVCLVARTGTEINPANESTSAEVPFTTALPPETPEKVELVKATTESLKVDGVLNPKAVGNAGTFEFLYKNVANGAGCEGEGSVGGSSTGAEGELAEAEATGLEPNAQYAICLRAHNEAGEESAVSATKTSTTLPLPAVIKGESAPVVKATEATLEAQVNPNNEETKYTFEYSTEGTEGPAGKLEGTITPVNGASELAAVFGDQPASVALTGLEAGKTYFYRVVAENGTLPVAEEEVKSFTTVPAPTTEEVTGITATFAVFHGHLKPLNEKVATQYHFIYNLGGGVCTGETGTSTVEAGKGPSTEVVASEGIFALQPDHEYTVCLVTTNASGSAEGAPVHFTTLALAPWIVNLGNSAPTTTETTLEAVVNPENQETSYVFEYASSEAALLKGDGTKFPGASPLPAEFTGLPVSQELTGLTPDTTYFYRVTAENAKGEKAEEDVNSFSTQGPPRVSTEAAQNLTGLGDATLEGTVYPGGLPTTYTFLYVPASEYEPGAAEPYAKGASSEPISAGEDSTVNPVFDDLVGLQPSTTYDYTLTATNAQGGPVAGANQTFTTPPLPTPSASAAAGAGETLPPAPAPGATLPVLSYPTIAALDAKEAQEDKSIPNPTGTGTKSLTRAERLAKALKACHKKKGASRTKCEKQAHSKYGKKKSRGKQ